MKNAMKELNAKVDKIDAVAEQRGANRALMQLARPSTIRKPKVFRDGDKWCALEGENIHDGICGFGNTPDAACRQFDIQWLNESATHNYFLQARIERQQREKEERKRQTCRNRGRGKESPDDGQGKA